MKAVKGIVMGIGIMIGTGFFTSCEQPDGVNEFINTNEETSKTENTTSIVLQKEQDTLALK
ncbi:hypothetical protein [Aquimarina spongiae]|uniref:Lipoprotein n=1 Tax=Aquimarina spongiae TaxID=570521 RepID=A0A1M6FDX2_9FLAO|nr:hypothetical protein [Aquimarina spongiae]SHI95846.1 hypothetical protein SAMN04488508_104233 [Aquimarina spongiae]